MRAKSSKFILAAAALMGSVSAFAAVLTVTPGASTVSGATAAGGPSVTPVTTWTGSDYSTSGSTTLTTTEKDVVIAPTATAAGLAYVYEVSTVTHTVTDHVYSYDWFSWSQSLTANGPGTEYLTFAGTVTASADTVAYLSVSSFGSYTPISSPPFGESVPALPSFFVRFGAGAWTPLSAASYTTPETADFYALTQTWLDLSAGVPVSFEVAVLAGANVDLEHVQVGIDSGDYDQHDVTSVTGSTSTRTLVGAELLAPVPEPETYALFAAGLLFVGLRLRNLRG